MRLPAGVELVGPLAVDQVDSTTVLWPGQRARVDRHGNLIYRDSARNFNPLMAMASTTTIAEAEAIVPVGVIPPDAVVTPGVTPHRGPGATSIITVLRPARSGPPSPCY